MTIQELQSIVTNQVFSEEPITGSLKGDKAYLNWLYDNYNYSPDEIYYLFKKKHNYADFCEQYLTDDSIICVNYTKHYKVSNLEHIEYDDATYVLIEQPEKVTRDLFSAHAFQLGDEIERELFVPVYNIAWEYTEDDDEPYDIEDPIYVQNLEENYNVIKGSL